MIALDDLEWAACDLLKIDVEGFESEVLKGCVGLIEQYRPVVIMETDKPFAQERYSIPNHQAEQFLLRRGYKVAAKKRPDTVFVPR